MNRVVLLGRLTKDPDVRYTQNQKVVCTFTLAVDRPFVNQDGKREADFIPVVLWGKPAEMAGNGCSKGQRLCVEGRIQTRTYDDENGTRHYVTEVVASGFDYIERKSDSTGGRLRHASRTAPWQTWGRRFRLTRKCRSDGGKHGFIR